MRGRIKVGGKAGVHVGKPDEGKEVTLSRDKNEVLLTTDMPFSKRCVSLDISCVGELPNCCFPLVLDQNV